MSDFPDDFLIGSATAAHQVEGGNVASDFWLLEHTEESKAKVQRRAEMIINKTTPVPESVG